jgi:arsenate reductase (glutaredoxin)
MITIYHNPRCSKSRATCDLAQQLNTQDETVEVIEYLKHPPTVAQLKALNAMLKCPIRDMIRSIEKEFAELGLDDATLTDNQLYEAIARHPILLQRPIVVRDGKAVIGRPPENIEALFD